MRSTACHDRLCHLLPSHQVGILSLLVLVVAAVQEADPDLHTSRRRTPWINCVAIELERQIDWLRPDFHDAAEAPANRHRPNVRARGLPVGGNAWLCSDVVESKNSIAGKMPAVTAHSGTRVTTMMLREKPSSARTDSQPSTEIGCGTKST